jgi:chaperonin GroES
MKLKPLHDRVLIKPLEDDSVSDGGIVIPDTAQEAQLKGKVISTGEGRITKDGKLIPMIVKEGDIVLVAKFSGQIVKIKNEEYNIIKEDDVLAIVE